MAAAAEDQGEDLISAGGTGIVVWAVGFDSVADVVADAVVVAALLCWDGLNSCGCKGPCSQVVVLH